MTKTKKTEQQELKKLLLGKRITALDYETSFFAFIIYNLINRSKEDFISLEFFKLNLTPYCRHFDNEESEKYWLNLDVNYNPQNVFLKLKQSLGLKYKEQDPFLTPIIQEDIYGEEIDSEDGDTPQTATIIKIDIPTENTKFIENYDDYISVYTKNGLIDKDLVNFNLQEAKIKRFIDKKLEESGNEYFWLSFDEIKSFDENNRVSLIENLQYKLFTGCLTLEEIIYHEEKEKFVFNSFSKFKLHFLKKLETRKPLEKIENIKFEFDKYKQLKGLVINQEYLELTKGQKEILQSVYLNKKIEDYDNFSSLSSQVSKINKLFANFQKERGIINSKNLILSEKNGRNVDKYYINPEFKIEC